MVHGIPKFLTFFVSFLPQMYVAFSIPLCLTRVGLHNTDYSDNILTCWQYCYWCTKVI